MLEIKNLSYKSEDDKIIVDNINLNFGKGITVITGQNGGGKTTLAKLIMGVIKPTSGSIIYNQQDITKLPINERANMGITIAFQSPTKFKGITVKDLLFFATNKNCNVKEACSYLSAVGLCARNYLEREINNTLSGGEQKRIELAVALAKGGEVYIFDEPEAGIDIWSFDELVKLFKSLKDKIVIIVSHNKKIIEIADKVVIINKNEKTICCDNKEANKHLESKLCGMQRSEKWN